MQQPVLREFIYFFVCFKVWELESCRRQVPKLWTHAVVRFLVADFLVMQVTELCSHFVTAAVRRGKKLPEFISANKICSCFSVVLVEMDCYFTSGRLKGRGWYILHGSHPSRNFMIHWWIESYYSLLSILLTNLQCHWLQRTWNRVCSHMGFVT